VLFLIHSLLLISLSVVIIGAVSAAVYLFVRKMVQPDYYQFDETAPKVELEKPQES